MIRITAVLGALVIALAGVAFTWDAPAPGQYLYILSNNVEQGQNSVIAYQRMDDGQLVPHPKGPFMTRGAGINNSTNGKLGPNDIDTPLIVSPDKTRLFAVNGYSNTIAVFDIQADGSLEHVSGSPFESMGVGPVSLAMSGDVLIVANRNEDPHQLAELSGAAYSNYATFRVGSEGRLTFLSKVELTDGQKNTQVLVSSRDASIIFGNEFVVDVDFDGEGDVSRLFGSEAKVAGGLQSFMLGSDGMLQQADRMALPETVDPAPEVPTIPLGIWDHPTRKLLYAGLVTRNQLGTFRYDRYGKLSFVSAVANSGQDICWLRVNKAGTRLYAVNNLPREDEQDAAGTITVFDISGDKAEQPVEISRIELPLPLGTFVNNRAMAQPNSTPFQLTLDEDERFLYVINQRIDQSIQRKTSHASQLGGELGNVLHVLRIKTDGTLEVAGSRHLGQDGVHETARPQGVVTLDM
ncbi:MAG: hypothetical protein HKM89_11980 [Gemmatimonadales bacterium]|nr:hypothetical protein [Gemmatimonadales bacterium]